MNDEQLHELLYQVPETGLGGVQVYETAIRCAHDDELRGELEKYHDQTTHHVELVEGVLGAFGLSPTKETPGSKVVRHPGEALVEVLVGAMEMALKAGDPDAAQLTAVECVTLAETKDHPNWELLGETLSRIDGDAGSALGAAHQEVEEQEDEHLYHSAGWGRELWIEALGIPAVLPPPEEQKDVKTAIGAARAKQARAEMT